MGEVAQNEANLPPDRQRGPGWSQACQTKPNVGRLGYLGDRTRDAGQMRQTNPIPGRPTGPYHSNIPLFQYSSSMPIVRNKPNFPPDDCGADFAKRTQFPAAPGGTKPQGRGARGKTCKTNPIWLAGCRSGGRNAQNEPNSPGRLGPQRWKSAKRTQFGRAAKRPGHRRPKSAKRTQFLDCGLEDRLPAGLRIVQNEPNLPGPHPPIGWNGAK